MPISRRKRWDGTQLSSRNGYMELFGADGRVLSRWRESYVLVRDRGYLKVRASVDHAQ
jgi:hypothetical protein